MASKEQILNMLDGGLITFMQTGKVRLYEFTVKYSPGGVLIILKGVSAEGYMVAFVGGATTGGVITKTLKQVRENNLRWNVDRFKAAALADLEGKG